MSTSSTKLAAMQRPRNIHPFEDEEGRTRYAVCVWNEAAGQYQAPLDSEQRRRTGCSAEFARTLRGMSGYKTLAVARYRAQLLYGYSKSTDRTDPIYLALTTINAREVGYVCVAAGFDRQAVAREAGRKLAPGPHRDLVAETEWKNLEIVSKTVARQRFGFDFDEYIPDNRYTWVVK